MTGQEFKQGAAMILLAIVGSFVTDRATGNDVSTTTVEQIAEFNCERNDDLRDADYERDKDLRSDIREFVTTLPLAPSTSPAEQAALEQRAIVVFAPGPEPESERSCEEIIEP